MDFLFVWNSFIIFFLTFWNCLKENQLVLMNPTSFWGQKLGLIKIFHLTKLEMHSSGFYFLISFYMI